MTESDDAARIPLGWQGSIPTVPGAHASAPRPQASAANVNEALP